MKQKTIEILLILIVTVAGGVFVLSKSQEAMTGAQGLVRAELSNALGSVVTLGQVEVTSYNAITMHDVTIYDKQAEPLVASEKITVTYSLLSMLRGQNLIEGISGVAVDKPTLWLTQASNGCWNIQDLLNKDNGAQHSFNSKVTLLEGRTILKASGGTWTLENVNGSVDFGHNPTIDLQLQAVHNGTAVKAKGTINSHGTSTITMGAGELVIADYQVLLPQGPLAIVGGSLQNIEVTVAHNQGGMEWVGEAKLAGVDMDVDGMPVRQVQGNIAFTNQKVYLFASANYLDQPVDVRGSIRIDTSQPIFDLAISSAAFDSSVITNNTSVSGMLAFKADVTGITTNPIIHGDVSLPTGRIAGYDTSNGKANVQVMDEIVTINNLSANIMGGHVALAGVVKPATGSYQLHLKAEEIDLIHLADQLPDSSGRATVDVAIKGIESFNNADIQGTVAMQQGKIAGVMVDSLGAGFYRQNGIIAIDYANIGIAQGLVTASGTIDHQNIAMTAYGKNLSLQQLNHSATSIVAGTGDFAGQIAGTLSQPEFTGQFTATSGQVFYQPFTEMKGNIQINRQQLTIRDGELVDGVTKHQVQGTLGLTGQQEINMTVRSHKARAENIIKLLLPDEKLTGNVDNDLLVTGSLDNIHAEGRLVLTDGSFRGQLIAKAQGFYKREQGITTISQCSIDSLNTQIKLAGSISPDNRLDFDITAQDIDIERLQLKLPYAAAGKAQFAGKVTGTASTPIFSGQLSSAKLTLNNQEFTSVLGEVTVHDNEVEIPHVSFLQGAGKFSMVGGFGLDTHEIYCSLDVENADLGSILAVANRPNKDVRGRVNGHMRLQGMLDNPSIWLTGTLREGSVKQYPIEAINIDVALENHVLKINDLSATQGAGLLIARGTADLQGTLDLEIGGRDIDAGLVATLLNTKIEPTGKMGFTAQISGAASDPHAAVSLEVVNGGVGTATFDSLYGLLIMDTNTIHVNQVLLKKGPYRASAYGTIPVASLSSAGRKQATIADQMDLKLRLDEANLSILPFLTKEVAWAEGPTQGEVNVTGTLEQPIVTGKVTVNNGMLKLVSLTNPIQKVGVDISFEGDTINIKKFDGHMGKGSYNLTGTAKIHGTALSDYNVSLALNKPEVQSKYFTGAVDGNLNFANRGSKPTLSGKLLFENNIVNIPAIPDMAPADLDIGLDIEMIVGKKVRFYNPYLYDILAEGKVQFAGSTVEPDFSGAITAVRGSVNYLRTQFKVNEASVEFKKFASLEPIITLNAQTKVQQIEVNLNVNGPLSEMQFTLTSEPAMRQQEILSLLTLRSHYIDKQNSGNSGSGGLGRDEIFGVLGAGLQLQFISDLEGNFRSVLGLDEFRLVKDTASNVIKKSYNDGEDVTTVSQEVYNIEMSKYLTDRLLLSYTMGIDHDKSDLSLRYELSKYTSFNTSIDEQKRTWFGLETRFRF